MLNQVSPRQRGWGNLPPNQFTTKKELEKVYEVVKLARVDRSW